MMGLWNGWGLGLGKNFLSKDTNGLPIEKEKKLWRMGDAYDKKMVHHEGIKQLWESKWKFPVWHLQTFQLDTDITVLERRVPLP